jgi:hypothetical protein
MAALAVDELSVSCKLFSNSPMQRGLEDSHLPIKEYQKVVSDVFIQIAMVKDLLKKYKYVERSDDEKLDFRLKKPGFKKLLIFDLDETLIHVKRQDIPEESSRDQKYFEPEVDLEVEDPYNETIV